MTNLTRFPLLLLAATLLLTACSDDGSEGDSDSSEDTSDTTADSVDIDGDTGETNIDPDTFDFSAPGPLGVGHRSFTIPGSEESGNAPISAEVWYPATSEGADEAMTVFATNDTQRTTLEGQLADADSTCTRLSFAGEQDAAFEAPPFDAPVLIFSHCLGCTRFSSATIAERLASFGFVVVGVDHAGNTYFDEEPQLNATALAQRLAEVDATYAFITDTPDTAPAEVSAILAAADTGNVGIFGHSFGSITSGNYAHDNPDIAAVAGLAAPFAFLGDVKVEEIAQPTLLVVLEEDNSISEFGNQLIRTSYDDLTSPAWLFEIPDAGHFAISSLCGIDEAFSACCGDGVRQTNGEDFTYPAAQPIRDAVANDVTAFFTASMLGSTSADAYLDARVEAREDNQSKP